MLGDGVVLEVVVELVVVEVWPEPPVLVEVTPLELVPDGPGVDPPPNLAPCSVVTRL